MSLCIVSFFNNILPSAEIGESASLTFNIIGVALLVLAIYRGFVKTTPPPVPYNGFRLGIQMARNLNNALSTAIGAVACFYLGASFAEGHLSGVWSHDLYAELEQQRIADAREAELEESLRAAIEDDTRESRVAFSLDDITIEGNTIPWMRDY